MYKIWIHYTNLLKRYRTETIFVTDETDVHTVCGDTICSLTKNGGGIIMNENHFQAFCKKMKSKKGHNSFNIWWILPLTEFDLYSVIYLCIKYESIILIFSKDNERKPFSRILQAIITPIIIGGFYHKSTLTCILWLDTCVYNTNATRTLILIINGNHYVRTGRAGQTGRTCGQQRYYMLPPPPPSLPHTHPPLKWRRWVR